MHDRLVLKGRVDGAAGQRTFAFNPATLAVLAKHHGVEMPGAARAPLRVTPKSAPEAGRFDPYNPFRRTTAARAGAASYYSVPGRIAGIRDDVITQGEVAKAFLPDLDRGQFGTIGKLYVKEAREHPEVVIERDAVPALAELLGARVGASTKFGRGGGFRSGVPALEPAVPYWAQERAASFRLSGNDKCGVLRTITSRIFCDISRLRNCWQTHGKRLT